MSHILAESALTYVVCIIKKLFVSFSLELFCVVENDVNNCNSPSFMCFFLDL